MGCVVLKNLRNEQGQVSQQGAPLYFETGPEVLDEEGELVEAEGGLRDGG